MSTMKEVEQEINEQFEIEQKLAKKKVDKTKPVEKKKGQPVSDWKPAARLPKLAAPEGYRVAWKANSAENIRRLQLEGWEVATRLEHNMDVDMVDYYRKVNDSPLSEKESFIKHNELIAMIIPEETAKAREEYHRKETEKQTRSKLLPENDPKNALLASRAQLKTTIQIE